jgi:hypothetical protein
MTSYERVKAAVEHKEADRVPFDLGGSVSDRHQQEGYINLRKYLGLPEVEIRIVDEMQQLARPDADFLRKIEVDVACVDPDGPSTPWSCHKKHQGRRLSAHERRVGHRVAHAGGQRPVLRYDRTSLGFGRFHCSP